MKRWWIMIGGVVALVAVIGGIRAFEIYQMVQGFKAAGTPKQAVSSTVAQYQEWRPTLSAIGSVRAVRGADLSPEVAGIVDRIGFESGDDVKQGDMLVQLRDADERARLAALQATANLAATTLRRDQAQFEARAISQATLDTDGANLKSAQAQVDEEQALIDKKTIRAPFSGTLGIRAVDVGQYLNPGTAVVTLQQLDPVFVDFTLPQDALSRVRSGQSVTVETDAFPGVNFTGKVAAVDARVDTDTRNIQVRASFRNPGHKLLPGMYTRVTIETGKPQRYLTLPDTAITYNPYGETVFVVMTQAEFDAQQKAAAAEGGDNRETEPGTAKMAPAKAKAPATVAAASAPGAQQALVVRQVFVTVGPKRGDQVAILNGLKAGDQVVTTGQLKLKSGTEVEINNAVQPSDQPNPKPLEH